MTYILSGLFFGLGCYKNAPSESLDSTVTPIVAPLTDDSQESCKAYLKQVEHWKHPPQKSAVGDMTLYGNPYLIWENVPGVWNTYNQDVAFTATINSLGFRGPEIDTPKPTGIRRFITIGDQTIYGFGVDYDEVFSSVAQSKLGNNVEAINAAVPGYSSSQAGNLMKIRGLHTEPDLFVIANIGSDNTFDSFVDKDLLQIYTNKNEKNCQKALEEVQQSHEKIILHRKDGWQVGSRHHDGRRRVEINNYAQNLEFLVQMAKENNAEVIFVMVANEDDVTGGGPNANDGPKAWTPYRNVMKDTANRHGAQLINVPELFRNSGKSKEELFMDPIHPTSTGHRIMGEALALALQNNRYNWVNGDSVMSQGDGSSLEKYEDPFVKE